MISNTEVMPCIPTRDMAAARRFYEDTLALEIELDDIMGGVCYRTPHGRLFLYESEFAGAAKHTLCQFLSNDVDADIEQLRDRGVRFETYDMEGVEWDRDVAVIGDQGKGVWFRDPDGNVLALFQSVRVPAHAG